MEWLLLLFWFVLSGIFACSIGPTHRGALCFWLGLLFGPFGLVAAAVLGNRQASAPAGLVRKAPCPSCRASVPVAGLRQGDEAQCPKCGKPFPVP